MIADEYKEFCKDLVRSFDKDWSKTQLKMDFGYQHLDHIPIQAWRPMVKIAIGHWEKWPPNWVRAVKEVYEIWRRDAYVAGVGIKYDKDDDPRFPVNLMSQAFDILDRAGYQAYRAYCDQVGMPKTDRDRCENKHRVCKANETVMLPETGHSVNPKTNRPAIVPLREFGD